MKFLNQQISTLTPQQKSANERLKEEIAGLNATYEEIAEKTGISKSTWLRATKPGGVIRVEYIEALSSNFNTDSYYIVTGKTRPETGIHYETEKLPEERINEVGEPWNPDDFVVVPFYPEVYASGGPGRVTENERHLDVAFRRRFFDSTVYTDWRNCFMIRLKGDSMNPQYPDGSELLVDENRKNIKEGPGFIVRIEDSIYCKLLRKLPGGQIQMRSLNDEYDPVEITPGEEGFEIIGEVIWHAVKSKHV